MNKLFFIQVKIEILLLTASTLTRKTCPYTAQMCRKTETLPVNKETASRDKQRNGENTRYTFY